MSMVKDESWIIPQFSFSSKFTKTIDIKNKMRLNIEIELQTYIQKKMEQEEVAIQHGGSEQLRRKK